MILKEFQFIEKSDDNNNWTLKNLKLVNNNLLVGKNASGKTRTLYFITYLSKILKEKLPLIINNGNFECTAIFYSENGNLSYHLYVQNKQVIKELLIQGEKDLIRRENNKNFIYSEQKQEKVTFKAPADKLTIQVRKHEEDYPYLEKLLEWAENVYSFSFSGQIFSSSTIIPYEMIFENLNKIYDIIQKREAEKGFKEAIIRDLNFIDYEVEDFELLTELYSGSMDLPLIIIKEKNLSSYLSAKGISAGMYRAFSILVIINHYLMMKKPCTLIIDDLGEGLDFDRSSKLTKLLFDKVKDSEVQLIVTSNDRFLMNAVDIKYWNILDRKGHIVTSYNYENSKDTFEEFSFTGLNNFDFFASEFYKEKMHD